MLSVTPGPGLVLAPTPVEGIPSINLLVATFTAADAAGTITAQVLDWGDGTGSPSNQVTIVQDGTIDGVPQYEVYASHTYAASTRGQNLLVQVGIYDSGDEEVPPTVSYVFDTTQVADALLFPVEPSPIAGTEGSLLANVVAAAFTDANPISSVVGFTARINWGDGSSIAPGTVVYDVYTESFRVLGSHTYAQAGTYSIIVSIADEGGSTLEIENFAVIQDANLTLGPTLSLGTAEGQTLSQRLVGIFTDANPFGTAGDFTATIDWGDSTPSTPGVVTQIGNSAGGAVFGVFGTHTYMAVGSYSIQVTLNDQDGESINAATSATVTVTDSPIQLAVFPLSATKGNPTMANQVVATFLDTGASHPVGDYGAVINWGDGSALDLGAIVALGGNTFNVTAPTHTYGSTGVFQYTVTLTDNQNSPHVATVSNVVFVGGARLSPSNSTAPPLSGVEGSPLNGVTVVRFIDPDLTAGAGSFAATINWGDGVITAGTVIGSEGDFEVIGTHAYNHLGSYTIQVSIMAVDGTALMLSNLVTVSDAALTLSPPLTLGATKGQLLNNQVVATFVDANPFASVADFTATIDWGDSSPAATGLVTRIGGSAAGTVFAISGSHTYLGPGFAAISVTVLDAGGSTIINQTSAVVTVAETPLSLSVRALSAVVGQATATNQLVATFLDHSGIGSIGDFAATIDWGDESTADNGAIVALGGGVYQVTAPAHFYAARGVYQVTVTVTSTDPTTIVGGNLAFVAPAPLVAVTPAPSVTALEGSWLSDLALAQFTDPDVTSSAADFTATIDWGDGTPTSIGTITRVEGTYSVLGTHLYTGEGSFTVKVTIAGHGVSSLVVSTVATVSNAPLSAGTSIPVLASLGQVLTNVPVATFRKANPFVTAGSFTATIDWGDESSSQGFVTLVGGGAWWKEFSVSGQHVYWGSGSYTITVVITGPFGQTTTVTSAATIHLSSLEVTAWNLIATEGQPTSAGAVVATFIDRNGPRPVNAYVATIDWGDSTSSTGTVAPLGGGAFRVSAPSHTFWHAGQSIITVTIAQDTISAMAASVASVADASLAASPVTATGVEGSVFHGVVATFTDANPGATSSDFSALINWGDGTLSMGTILPNLTGGFDVDGTHVYSISGQYSVVVEIDSAGGSQALTNSILTIADAILTPGPAQTFTAARGVAVEGVSLGSFTDANPLATAAPFTATILWGDNSPNTAGVIVQDSTGAFHVQGSHLYAQAGSFAIVVLVQDVGGSTATLTATALVSDSPQILTGAPVIATPGTALPNAQNLLNGTVVATLIDNGGPKPASAYTITINWGNGQITPGTLLRSGPNYAIVAPASPAITYNAAGAYAITVTVTDPDASSPSGFNQAVVVTTANVLGAILTTAQTQPQVNATQGVPLTAVVSQFTDSNPTASPGGFTATIDWGDGTPQSAGSFLQPGGPGTAFSVTGNHTYANATTPPLQPYRITVDIRDPSGVTLTTSTQAIVSASTITGTAVMISAIEGQPLSNATVATFVDSGIPGPLSSYSATINLGNSTPTFLGMIVPLGGHAFAVQGSFTYPQTNASPTVPYTITVVIGHDGLPAVTVLSSALVADAPLSGAGVPAFPTEGAPFTGTVAIFRDFSPNARPNDYAAMIEWGDGTSSSGRVVASGASFLVTGADPVSGQGHIYRQAGSYTFGVTIQSVGGAQLSVFAVATVADAPLTATGVTVTAPEYPAFAGTVATFTDANPFGVLGEYTANINWGDGVTTPGTITNNPMGAGFVVIASHQYRVGAYWATVLVRAAGGATAQALSTFTITDLPLTAGPAMTVQAVEGAAFTAQVATFTDANPQGTATDYSATIDWGDRRISAGTITALAPGSFTVTGSHTYVEESGSTPYSVQVTIRDLGGSTTTAAASAVVTDAPLFSLGTPIAGIEGNSIGNELVAILTDSNPGGTAGDFRGVIQWGDGTSSAASFTPNGTTPTGVTFSVSGSHTYAQAGSYKFIVSISDIGGSETVASALATILVAALAPTASQPAVITTEGQIFSGAVVTFTAANPIAPASDFHATIDWGDGTPRSSGLITLLSNNPARGLSTFSVSGNHTYANARVNGGTGLFPIIVNAFNQVGSTVQVSNVAQVADVAIAVFGTLNPASDTGGSNSDAITRLTTPNFYGGVSQPYSTIQLFIQPVGTSTLTLVGQTSADGSGTWSITSSPLAQGSYSVFVKATDPAGYTTAISQVLPNATQGALVIDTAGPKVTGLIMDGQAGQVTVVLQDNLSGMNQFGLISGANYGLSGRAVSGRRPKGPYLITSVATSGPSQPTAPQAVTLFINRGRPIAGGTFRFLVTSGGIADNAGNPLDGVFYGSFPSGVNGPRSNFLAKLVTKGNVVYSAIPIPSGYASPLGQPASYDPTSDSATVPKVKRPKAVAKAKVVRGAMPVAANLHVQTSVAQPTRAHALSVHDQALAGLHVPTK